MKKLLSLFVAVFLLATAISQAQYIPTGGTGGGGSTCTTCECLGTCMDVCSGSNPPCYCTDSCDTTDRCNVINPPCDCTGTCDLGCFGDNPSSACEPACSTQPGQCLSGSASGLITPVYPNKTSTWSCTSTLSGQSLSCSKTEKNTCVETTFVAQPSDFSQICTVGGFISTGATLETINGVQTNYFTGYCPDSSKYDQCRYNIGNTIRISALDGSDSQETIENGVVSFSITVTNIYTEPLRSIVVSDSSAPDCDLSASESALRYAGGATPLFDSGESFVYTCVAENVSEMTFPNNKNSISVTGTGTLSGQLKSSHDFTIVLIKSLAKPGVISGDLTSGTGEVPISDTRVIGVTSSGSTTSGSGTTTSGTAVVTTGGSGGTTSGSSSGGGGGSTSGSSIRLPGSGSGGSGGTGSSPGTTSGTGGSGGTGPGITSPDPILSDIAGTLYYDENKNGMYDLGEGVADIQVEISNTASIKWYNTTDEDGVFRVTRIPDGKYDIRITGTSDIFFPIVIPIEIQGGDFSGTFAGFKREDIEINPGLIGVYKLYVPGIDGDGNMPLPFSPGIDILNPDPGPTIDNPYTPTPAPDNTINNLTSYLENGYSLSENAYSPITLALLENQSGATKGNVCGNGIVDVGEVCDDFDKNGQKGFCSANCLYLDEAVSAPSNLGSNALGTAVPESSGVIQRIRSSIAESRVFQMVAGARIVKQSIETIDRVIGIENIKEGVATSVEVAKATASVALVVAQYSVIGVVSLLGVAGVGSNIMVYKAHWMKYTVQEGDTLESISDKFTMTTRKIGQRNKLLRKGGKLKPGMQISVRNRHFMEKDYLDQLKFVLKDVLQTRHLGRLNKRGKPGEADGIDTFLDKTFDFVRKYISPVFSSVAQFIKTFR